MAASRAMGEEMGDQEYLSRGEVPETAERIAS